DDARLTRAILVRSLRTLSNVRSNIVGESDTYPPYGRYVSPWVRCVTRNGRTEKSAAIAGARGLRRMSRRGTMIARQHGVSFSTRRVGDDAKAAFRASV